MANALSQNIETDKNNALDIIMQSVNISSKNQTQETSDSKFSNIMNNLDARTQRAQKNFDDKAKVSNISSINKKALDKKEITTKETSQTKTKDVVSNTTVKPEKTKKVQTSDVKENATINNKEIEKSQSVESSSTVVDKNISNKDIQQNEDVQSESTEKKDNLSDINNSSHVDSSPVISLNKEENSLKDNELNVELKVQESTVVDNSQLVNTKEFFEKIKEQIDDIASIEDVEKINLEIEQIASSFDEMNLSKETKNDVLETLEKLQQKLNELDFNFEDELKIQDNIANLKSQVELSTEAVDTQLKNDTIKVQIEHNELKSDFKVDDKNLELKSDKTLVEENETTIKVDNKISEKIQSLIDEISKVLENKEVQDVVKFENIELKDINEIESLISENKDKIDFLKDFDEKLTKALDKLKELFNAQNLNHITQEIKVVDLSEIKDVLVDFTKQIENNNSNSFDKIAKIDVKNIDVKNIDIKNDESMNEILNILQEFEQSQDIDFNNEDIKAQVEKLVQQMKNNELSSEQIVEAVSNLQDDIKLEIKNANDVELEQNIDLEPELTVETDLNSDLNQEFEMNEQNFKKVEINTKAPDLKNVADIEQNLQKTVAIQDMLDDMMVEVNVKTIPTQSGALSVADEVIKFAIGEQNSLNSANSIHGSITYDNSVIKNPVQLMKLAQPQAVENPSMEDVLGQISNKITQLKDAQGQKLTMVLRPNDLGRLSIELISNQEGLSTQIMAQNEDVRAYIEKNINSLRQQLSDAGVQVNTIQIKTMGQEGSTSYDGNQNFNKDQQQENFEHQNNKNNQNNSNNKQKNANEILASMANYDMHFAKDFSSIMNKSLSYNLN